MKGLTLSDEDPDLVFGAIEEGWLVRSRDGGRTWQQIDQGVPHGTHTGRFVPGQPSTPALGTNSRWLRSTDWGDTWAGSKARLARRAYTPAAPLVPPGVLFCPVTPIGARG